MVLQNLLASNALKLLMLALAWFVCDESLIVLCYFPHLFLRKRLLN
jgi:hypothetical protein